MKNKKNQKKIQRTTFITGLNFSEKNFLQKSRNDSVVSDAQKGGVPYYRPKREKRPMIRAQYGRIVFIFSFFVS